MNSTGDDACKHLRTNAHIRRAKRICVEDCLIALTACRFKNVVGYSRVLGAWTLFEEHPVGRRISL
jgi:hypothetical protein